MTIEEKIKRLKVIPKSIAEKEEDRKRLSSSKSVEFDRVGFSASKNNSAERNAILYTEKGIDIDALREEKDALIRGIQAEIDEKIIGEDMNSIDTRRILKAYFLDNHNLKYISSKMIFRSYATTKELFQKACKKLEIALNSHQ